MACPALITGDQFLLRALTHIDCQAQLLGSYGYQALGQPGSLASVVVTALLTLFIALFAIRLLFGPPVGGRDIVFDVLKIGIVLTLAFSWPAFRTLIYDVTLHGPAEIASSIQTQALPESGGGFAQRLQNADNAMTRLMESGTGRQTGAYIDEEAPGGTFRASMLEDESAFGWARLIYLAGIIGSLALLRIVAGLLLALAPLAAGMLLFEQTRGLFSGWLRGLVLAMVGSLGVTLVLAVELAMLEPWLTDARTVRASGYATPAAPIELFALTLAFAAVQFAIIWLLARVAFTRGWRSMAPWEARREPGFMGSASPYATVGGGSLAPSRVERIASSVETHVAREQRVERERLAYRGLPDHSGQGTGTLMSESAAGHTRLGSSYRRTARRSSGASQRRDQGE